MPNTPGAVRVEITVDTRENADRLAESAVGRRLAACAQVGGPVTSHYRWEGEVHRDQEWTVVFKTAQDRLDELTAHIVREHPYDVPEVVAVPVVGGEPAYLAWVIDETRPDADGERGAAG
ncbi:divalent-cation tolerance protein CutA [Nocardiopsis sp. NPDC006139]|uniref:divalent-cation tolerance protein CutA n=1 Tax=Nocardiopsis TaxID=2013 RepID=UPI0033AACFCC